MDFPTGADFPDGNIPDGEKYEGFYWDAAAGVWKRDCPPGMIYYGEEPPCMDDLPLGALFTDEDTLKQFVHTGNCNWVETTSCGAGEEGNMPGGLTAVNFTGYRARSYQGTPGSDRTILTELFWETQEGIHFEDEITVEVDMQNDGNWEDVHLMDQAQLDAYEIGIVFAAEYGGVAFNFDYKGTHDGPWDPHPTFPCAQMRVTIKNINLENDKDFTIKTSDPTFVFPEYKQDPAEPTPVPAHPGASC